MKRSDNRIIHNIGFVIELKRHVESIGIGQKTDKADQYQDETIIAAAKYHFASACHTPQAFGNSSLRILKKSVFE